jgi:thymidylate kinase
VSRIEKEARDVGREETEQLQTLRSAYEEYDAAFRAFRAAIVRSDSAEKVNKRIPQWIPLSVH